MAVSSSAEVSCTCLVSLIPTLAGPISPPLLIPPPLRAIGRIWNRSTDYGSKPLFFFKSIKLAFKDRVHWYLVITDKNRRTVLVHKLIAAISVNVSHFCAVYVERHPFLINPQVFWMKNGASSQAFSERGETCSSFKNRLFDLGNDKESTCFTYFWAFLLCQQMRRDRSVISRQMAAAGKTSHNRGATSKFRPQEKQCISTLYCCSLFIVQKFCMMKKQKVQQRKKKQFCSNGFLSSFPFLSCWDVAQMLQHQLHIKVNKQEVQRASS